MFGIRNSVGIVVVVIVGCAVLLSRRMTGPGALTLDDLRSCKELAEDEGRKVDKILDW